MSRKSQKPPEVEDHEVQLVREAVTRLSARPCCRVEACKNAIVVSEPAGGKRFEEVMRFVVYQEGGERTFHAQRKIYRGGPPRWFPLFACGALAEVVDVVRHVGRESFYELM